MHDFMYWCKLPLFFDLKAASGIRIWNHMEMNFFIPVFHVLAAYSMRKPNFGSLNLIWLRGQSAFAGVFLLTAQAQRLLMLYWKAITDTFSKKSLLWKEEDSHKTDKVSLIVVLYSKHKIVICVSGFPNWPCSIISSSTSQSLLPRGVHHVEHVLPSACHTSSQYCKRGICCYNTRRLPEYCHHDNICQSQWDICWNYTNSGNISRQKIGILNIGMPRSKVISRFQSSYIFFIHV